MAIGMVALDAKHQSNQSAKSVYPLAIANCKEKRSVKCFLYVVALYIFSYTFLVFFWTREDLRKLFDSLNKWKNELKQNGIFVDGRHYHVKFKGTFCSYN